MSASRAVADARSAIAVPSFSTSEPAPAQSVEIFFARPLWTAFDRALIVVWCGAWSAQQALARVRAGRARAHPPSARWLIDIDYDGALIASLGLSEGEAVCHQLAPHAGGRLRFDAFSFSVREPSPQPFKGRVAAWLSLRSATDAEATASALFATHPAERLQLDVAALASLRGALLK